MLLIVEKDADLQSLLEEVLTDEGYAVRTVASLEEALVTVKEESFALILADLFVGRSPHSFTAAHILRRRVRPTPVGLLMTNPLAQEDAQGRGFAFVLPMPFELERLMLHVAATLNQPLTQEQALQAEVIRQYLWAMEEGDWKALTACVLKDVIYYPPPQSPLASSRVVQGLRAFLAYAKAASLRLPDFHFQHPRIYSTPRGMVAYYLATWQGEDGSVCRLPGAIAFRFNGDRIQKIGAHWIDGKRFEALMGRQAG